jgi:hypothetical protein
LKVAAFSSILVTTFRITHHHIPEEPFTVAITRLGLRVTRAFLASWYSDNGHNTVIAKKYVVEKQESSFGNVYVLTVDESDEKGRTY